MFLVIIPKQGKTVTHEAEHALEITVTPNFLYLIVDYTDSFKYPLGELECWNGYPSREAALVDGADLRDYPALR